MVGYFARQLSRCKTDDGKLGPAKALPLVLVILGAIQQHIGDVKPVSAATAGSVRGRRRIRRWLYRDLRHSSSAAYWYERSMEWAQAANDTAMQGYVLLKKSQMAYEERDAQRVATLAEAAQCGPWQLPAKVRVEVTQQEARGLAMLGASIDVIERKLDEAQRLFASGDGDDRPQFGTYFNTGALLLRSASCYIEAGKPGGLPSSSTMRLHAADSPGVMRATSEQGGLLLAH